MLSRRQELVAFLALQAHRMPIFAQLKLLLGCDTTSHTTYELTYYIASFD